MSGDAIAELFVRLKVESDDAVKGLAETGKAAEDTDRKTRILDGALANLVASGIKGLASLGVAAVRAGAAFAVDLVKGFADAGNEIAKTSGKLGVSTDTLQRMRHAAEQTGSSADVLNQALRDQNKFLLEARSGATPFTQALKDLGLSLTDIAAMDPEARLGAYGDALAKVADPGERAATAARLLGEEAGPQLGNLLALGSEGLRKMGDEAAHLGKVMKRETLADAEALTASMLKVNAVIDAAKMAIGAALAPIMTDLAEKFRNWFKANQDIIAQRIQDFFDKLKPFIDQVAAALPALIDFMGKVAEVFTTVIEKSGGLENALGLATAAFVAFHAAAFGIPGIMAVVGAAIGTMIGRWIFDLDALEDRIDSLQKKNRLMKAGNDALGTMSKMLDNPRELAEMSNDDFNKLVDTVLDAPAPEGDGGMVDRARAAAEHVATRDALINRMYAARKFQIGRKQERDAVRAEVDAEIAAEAKKKARRGTGKAKGAAKGTAAATAAPKGSSALTGAGGSSSSRGGFMGLLEGLGFVSQEQKGDTAMDRFADAIRPALEAAGGGMSPTEGARFIKIDQSFHATTAIHIEIESSELAGMNRDEMGALIERKVAAEQDKRNRALYEHYSTLSAYG